MLKKQRKLVVWNSFTIQIHIFVFQIWKNNYVSVKEQGGGKIIPKDEMKARSRSSDKADGGVNLKAQVVGSFGPCHRTKHW